MRLSGFFNVVVLFVRINEVKVIIFRFSLMTRTHPLAILRARICIAALWLFDAFAKPRNAGSPHHFIAGCFAAGSSPWLCLLAGASRHSTADLLLTAARFTFVFWLFPTPFSCNGGLE